MQVYAQFEYIFNSGFHGITWARILHTLVMCIELLSSHFDIVASEEKIIRSIIMRNNQFN